MPAKSVAQRRLMALAEHHPDKLHKQNRGLLNMSQSQLHDFASTKGLKKSGDQGSHLDETDHHQRMGHTNGS